MPKLPLALAATIAFIATTGSTFAAQPCDRPFKVAFRSGSDLHLDLRAGDIEIEGSDDSKVHVTCIVDESDGARNIKVQFRDNGKVGRLEVSGGPNNGVRLRIQLPRESNLVVRCSAGDVDILGIRGHKDVSLRAGDLTIDVGNASDYASARASVTAGDLHATAFGVHKGGLFRSFQRENRTGKYRLQASLWAGDLTLR